MQYFPSGRTVLVIAHRLSTIRSANLIYVIMDRKVLEFVDGQDHFMKLAIEKYFSTQLERNPANPILKFNYTDKDVKGIQAGFICEVIEGEKSQRYYAKGHSLMSSNNVDLHEIFIYCFLHEIGLGPVVHIVPNIHTSTNAVYIIREEGIRIFHSIKKPKRLAELSSELRKDGMYQTDHRRLKAAQFAAKTNSSMMQKIY
ncbi:hypothetical protein L3Y34_016072 [Caenorhabditis briggsae]|uniref:Uncharacterized protein n=1 Tax=Caenorhabditis briggsae TaxID=6238 RepID=A0AAE9DWE7_CAEBR|nr:hypothetical protein L3Y34_016072 [Caenorhabditis briggsae]